MEVPSLGHGITSPMSPCEGMVSNLSLESLELCERDGKDDVSPMHFLWFSVFNKKYDID